MLILQHCDGVLNDLYVGPFPGYAFLLFQDESSVQALIDACIQEDGKLYLCVSSPTIKDKPVSLFPCLAATCLLSILLNTNVLRLVPVICLSVSENWKVQYCCTCFVCHNEGFPVTIHQMYKFCALFIFHCEASTNNSLQQQ